MGAAAPPPAPPPAGRGRAGTGACGVVVAGVGAAAALVAADAAFTLPVAARIALWVGWIGLVLALARWPRRVPWPVGAAAVGATVAAAVAIPGAADNLRRVGMPWHRPDPAPSHRIVIPHPEPVVRRGDPLTLSAFAEPLSPDADPPDGAALVVRPAADRTGRRLPMRPDGAGAFHLTLPPVYDDFLYRVEAGGAASPWHTVRAADPVELADDTAVTVTPPAYTGATPVTRPGVEGVDGLQHSTAAFRLAFTRPAAVAFLTWQPATGVPDRPVVPVELGEGGLTGTATVRLTTDGVYRLVLATEPGLRQLRTEIAIPVRVTADAPPRFEALDGVSPRPVARPPNSRVEIAFTVADDLGVAGVVLEYVPGSGGEPKRESVPLTGAGTPRAEGRVTLDLAGNGAAGQTVRFRLRAADARAVPDANLTPQEGVYPPTGWAEVGLSASTPPADRQEADGLRDAARDALRGAADAVGAALAEVEALLGSDQFAAWPLDHAVRLESAREQVRAAAGQLHDAARELVLRPDLRPFAADIGATADGLHRTAAEWMGDAPPDRRAALRTAADRLGEASSRLDGLTARADRVTRDWLDRRRLAAVAADPRNVEARLRDILADSEPLRRAILRSAARDARRFAAEAEGIADRVGHLDAAARHLETEARRAVLGRLARSQAEAAERAAGLLARADTAARLARVPLPAAAEFRRAAGLVAGDKSVEALVELEALARALDRAAGEFDTADAERVDGKAAARQLAGWQDDLRRRLAAATRATPFAGLPDPVKTAFRTEQRAVLTAAERLDLPPGSEVAAPRDTALGHLRRAADRLDADGVGAGAPAKLAAEALAALSERTPPAADRLAGGRAQIDRHRVELESLAADAERAFNPFQRSVPDAGLQRLLASKWTDVSDRQRKLADGLARLDLPGFAARRARAVAAARAAAADLKAGLPLDAAASLAQTRRELERLRQAVDGTPPADAAADDLGRTQRGIADAAGQQEVARRVGAITPRDAPEATDLLADAREAVRQTEGVFRDGVKPEERVRLIAAAADALAKLADRLNGRESDLDRVRRLAANRRRAVEAARTLTGRPLNAEVSGAARKELGREGDELTSTRVGAAGQPLKRRAAELYARLGEKAEPDRDAGAQAALADVLDALARSMAGNPELTAGAARDVGPPEPDPADLYLPSRRLAALLRDQAAQVRAVRERVNGVGAEVARRLRPAPGNPLGEALRRQRTLTAAADELTRSVPAKAEAAAAAWACRLAADGLEEGRIEPAKAAAERAARRLKAVAAAGTGRPWGGVAAELAGREMEVVADLIGWQHEPGVAAAQQAARREALAAEAEALARRLQRSAADVTVGKRLGDAAEPVRTAGALLDDAKGRPEAERLLRAAAGAMIEGLPGEDAGAGELAVGDALRQALAALRRGEDGLVEVVDALQRATQTTKEGPIPGERGASAP